MQSIPHSPHTHTHKIYFMSKQLHQDALWQAEKRTDGSVPAEDYCYYNSRDYVFRSTTVSLHFLHLPAHASAHVTGITQHKRFGFFSMDDTQTKKEAKNIKSLFSFAFHCTTFRVTHCLSLTLKMSTSIERLEAEYKMVRLCPTPVQNHIYYHHYAHIIKLLYGRWNRNLSPPSSFPYQFVVWKTSEGNYRPIYIDIDGNVFVGFCGLTSWGLMI